jgi:uroporphyrinogen-III synthase
MAKSKRILVSRNLKTGSKLRKWAVENGHELVENPFISVKPVLNVEIPQTDWIFFASPNGVDIYLQHYPLMASKIAVFGKGTEQRLKANQLSADFVGDSKKTPTEIGENFFNQIKDSDSILFPQSQLSKKSISKVNNSNVSHEIVVYNTSIEANIVEGIDIAILTSPSNIDGFLMKNNANKIKFVVLGVTSKKHFEDKGLGADLHVPESASEESVIQLLKEVIQ